MSVQRLRPTLGLFSSTMLATSIVVGAGMLVLPGLVFKQVGPGAYWCWVSDALLSIPLLWVFVRLGKAYPSAGGVAGFVAAVWPRARAGVGLVLLGTFSLGIPAIALTGGRYLLAGLGMASGPLLDSLVAFALLSAASGVVFLGARLAGGWQNVVVCALLLLLALLTLATVPDWSPVGTATLELPSFHQGMAMAFFSYTGFEMFSAIAEDMKNPQRDFRRAVFISFLLISLLYVGAALAIESTVPRQHPALDSAPFMPLLQQLTGPARFSAQALGALVAAIILANLVGATWAASRMLFDLGRATSLGTRLGLHVIDAKTSSPRRAVAASLLIFAGVLCAHAIGLASVADMLWLASQNFLLLYGACVVVFLATTRRPVERLLALFALVPLLSFGTVFSWALAYPMLLFVLPGALRPRPLTTSP